MLKSAYITNFLRKENERKVLNQRYLSISKKKRAVFDKNVV
ncbi:hypothetical protein HMPREF0766_13957 [Sphingobacterium spiritivorum ATCC 33861]|uniref:Uncharacterized protein n=1 Tax=Sphingobacterium spiritivorum ATCC 33861 TaxID=525373 RepID=D7VSK3_SPHSI|nr:hypothetical protein HMPREF0766_13957 [Sphingobacterium spiritivorum ATCC 33861]